MMVKAWLKNALPTAGEFLKNSFTAVLRGEFLLRLNVGRYFIHIIYTFVLFGIAIWVSLMIDTALTKVEKNKATIREMEILYSQKAFDVAELGRRGTVAKMLEQMGSPIKQAEKPAMTVEK